MLGLDDVYCANKNHKAVVVCFNLALRARKCEFFRKFLILKFFLILYCHDDVNSMMSWLICNFWWPSYFYHEDTYRIKLSHFNLLWGVRYQHLYDFSHFQKCNNTSLLRVWKFLQDSNSPTQAKNIPTCQKQPWGFPVSPINSVHINMYTHITYLYY